MEVESDHSKSENLVTETNNTTPRAKGLFRENKFDKLSF